MIVSSMQVTRSTVNPRGARDKIRKSGCMSLFTHRKQRKPAIKSIKSKSEPKLHADSHLNEFVSLDGCTNASLQRAEVGGDRGDLRLRQAMRDRLHNR